MKIKHLEYLILIFIFSCKKNDNNYRDKLPEATARGAGTMGFNVDGKTYAASRSYSQEYIASGEIPSQSYQFFDDQYHFILGASRTGQWKWNLYLGSDSITFKEGMKIKLGTIGQDKAFASFMDDNGKDYLPVKNAEENFLFITHIDETKTILSGTFQFDAFDSVNNKTVKIRDGRFDIIYYK